MRSTRGSSRRELEELEREREREKRRGKRSENLRDDVSRDWPRCEEDRERVEAVLEAGDVDARI